MREILFRGKRVDNGEWVEGFLSKSRNIEEKPAELKFCIDREEKGVMISSIVDPDTVGQYTGLTDKNGRQIFEGDIVEFYFFDKTRRDGELIEVKNIRTMLIEWHETSFYMRELFRNYRLDKEMGIIIEILYDYRGDRKQFIYKSNSVYFVEVIGSIYDNPELLEI